MWPSETSLGVLSSREIPARFPSDQHVANTWPLIVVKPHGSALQKDTPMYLICEDS